MQLRKGDTFQTRGAMRTVEFKVMDIATATEEEAEYCYINEDTEILYEGEALKVNPRSSAAAIIVCVAGTGVCGPVVAGVRSCGWWRSWKQL